MNKRPIVEINEARCTGCGDCILACAEGALKIINGKAKLLGDILCDGFGVCLDRCPEDAILIIERDAEAFDEKAVETMKLFQETMANTLPETPAPSGNSSACGCPGTAIRQMQPVEESQRASPSPLQKSQLAHWPIQLRLIPPHAPFLREADLMLVADCVPVTVPDFHQKYLKGKALAISCPKFDNPQESLELMTRILQGASIKSVTVLVMEVPCCTDRKSVVGKAIDQSGKDIQIHEITIGINGKEWPQRAPHPQFA